MPRRREITRRETIADPKFNSKLLARFINCVMRRGKRSTAEQVVYEALDSVRRKTGEEPLKIFEKAMDNVKPVIEVKSRRVGGSTYQVPIEVRPERRVALAIRWLIGYAHSRPEKGMGAKLAAEFIDAAAGRGGAVKKREDTHRMAEANKAFAHYRW
jgi:small subunit ribosomal protein S7